MAFQRKNQDGGGNKGGGKNNKNEPPSLQDYLEADKYYQAGIGDIKTSWTDYIEGQREALSRIRGTKVGKGKNAHWVGGDYLNTLGQMQQQKRRDLRDINADYAARGIAFSGGRVRDLENYRTDWTKAKEDLQESRNRGVEDIQSDISTQQGVKRQQKHNLWLDAVRRRAQEWGLR